MTILWYNYDLSNIKEFVKCIKHIEKICRASLEYDEWARKCKYKDAQVCPICNDDYYDKNSTCETHHHPETLYCIVENILTEHINNNVIDSKTGLEIVQEVMDKHMLGQVSYINLCVHCHKKYHAGHPDVCTAMDIIFTKRANDHKALEPFVPDIVDDKPLIITESEIPPASTAPRIDETIINLPPPPFILPQNEMIIGGYETQLATEKLLNEKVEQNSLNELANNIDGIDISFLDISSLTEE